jgi:hypothetical protein
LKFDSVTKLPECPDHSDRAHSLGLFAHRRAALLIANAFIQNHPDQLTETMRNRPDGFVVAALGDWVDFVFVPSPEVVAIYADHDEYTTFYTRDDATLKNLASGLEKSGFEAVRDYTRRSSGDKWR